MYIVEIVNGNHTRTIHDLKSKLESGKITKGINAIDSFTFSMLPNNPGFSLINEFTTLVTVYNANKGRTEFTGRALYAETTMADSGLISKSVTCESIFGYLCDSQQSYVDPQNWTVRGLLQHLIDCHNSQTEEYKHFKIGTVTATDKNDNLYLGIQRENTWDAIKSNLLDKIGGELQCRVEEDGIYIDYLEQVGEQKTTEIALSVNMKSITREQDPTTFVTRLIPLGCKQKITVEVEDENGWKTEEKETEHRLDITSVNNGRNYIDDEEAIAVYGIHVGTVEWDDVTEPENLLTKGRTWLEENNKVQVKYSITALDLSLLGLILDDFDVGNWYPLKNSLIGVDDVARVIKKTVDICNETESSIEIGDSFKTLSDIQRDIAAQLKAAEENVNNLQKESNNFANQLLQINKIIAESKAFIGVTSTAVFYYLSTSNTALEGGDWSETPPEWEDGCYYWQKIVTTYTDDSTTESDPVCISGEKGEAGVGIDSIKTQFYLSDNKLSQSGGSWVETMPTWSKGLYLWTRSVIVYDNGSVEYTEPICDTAWELVNAIEETFTTKIEQLERSITLEVSGSLGSEASIILSAGANKYTGNFDLSKVREAFAKDNTAISISAGIITFNSGTIVINSTNFYLDTLGNVDITGNIKATSGRIGEEGTGWTIDKNSIFHGSSFGSATAFFCTGSNTTQTIAGHTGNGWVLKAGSNFGVTKDGTLYCRGAEIYGNIVSETGLYRSELHSGGLNFYLDGDQYLSVSTGYDSDGATTTYFHLTQTDAQMEFMRLISTSSSGISSWRTGYRYGYVDGDYETPNIFMEDVSFRTYAHFRSRIYTRSIYMHEGNYIFACDADGNWTRDIIGSYSDGMSIGDSDNTTMIRGSTVYLKNTSTTVTSDRNAKNSIETLPEAYEAFIDALDPVRFKYNEGTSGRYHVGYIAQDVEAALASAGLSTQDFAGYVDINKKGELGLIYDEFIALLHRKIKKLENRINEMESMNHDSEQ